MVMNNSTTSANRTARRTRQLMACAVLGLTAAIASPRPAHAHFFWGFDDHHHIMPPAVPANLVVPAGNKVVREGNAIGTQNYICLPAGAGFAWTFFGPQATLFNDEDEQIITHFLSANPAESGTPRATWQDSDDTSAVWAKAIANSTDPAYVAPGAIPWLLLQVVGTQEGPTGGDRLTKTTYIQRLNTSGGVAPTAGCAASTDVGAKALVPYTANYFFYMADHGH
jgi:hypothetical protein